MCNIVLRVPFLKALCCVIFLHHCVAEGDYNPEGYENLFADPSAHATRSPAFFANNKEILEGLAIATPAYGWLGYTFMESVAALSAPQIALGIGAGYLTADFLSGIGHLITDSLNPELFPESLAAVFRGSQKHHDNPTDVFNESVWGNNKKYHIASYVFLGITTALRMAGYDFASEVLSVAILFNMWTGWFHTCGHGGYPDSFFVKTLQNFGLILSKEGYLGHSRHHDGVFFNKNYCVISGWMNPPLNALCRVGRFIGGFS